MSDDLNKDNNNPQTPDNAQEPPELITSDTENDDFSVYKPDPDKYFSEQEALKEPYKPQDPLFNEPEEIQLVTDTSDSLSGSVYTNDTAEPLKEEEPLKTTFEETYQQQKEPSIISEVTNDETNLFSGLCYLSNVLIFTMVWLPIIVYFIKPDDNYVKFHAKQSAIYGITCVVTSALVSIFSIVVGVITAGCGSCLMVPLIFLLMLALWIYAIYITVITFSGTDYRIPYISKWADSINI